MLRRSSITRSSTPLRQRRKCLPGSEAAIKQELTILFSLYIRQRDKECVLCHTTLDLECSHFWHRSMPGTEFDPENCYAMCRRENQIHEYNPQPFRDWLLLRIGERRFGSLGDRAHDQKFKLGYSELLILFDEIKRKVKL